jgi:hypothetical protein
VIPGGFGNTKTGRGRSRGAAVSQTSRSGRGRRGRLRVVLRTHPRSGRARRALWSAASSRRFREATGRRRGHGDLEFAGGFRLARAGAALARGRASDRDGGKPPVESGDESPHSKAMRVRSSSR